MLSRLALCTLAIGLMLFTLQKAVGVIPFYGIEDYLGWINENAIGYLNEIWRDCKILWLAFLYLLIDTLLFIPIYGMFFLILGRQLFSALAGDSKQDHFWGAKLYSGLLLAVILVDLTENVSGVAKISGDLAARFFPLTAVAIWVAQVRAAKKHYKLESEEIWNYCRKLGWPVLVIALVIFIGAMALDGNGQCNAATSMIMEIGCKAHHVKFGLAEIGLVGALVIIALAAALLWFSGLRIPKAEYRARAVRSEVRLAFADIVARSRYVLAALVIFSGAALVMDQGRDLLGAMASQVAALFGLLKSEVTNLEIILGIGTGIVGLLVIALGIWMFCFSCWLWSRSAIQASREHAPQPERAHSYLANKFACEWARLLGLAPLIILSLLCAAAFGDAVKVGERNTAIVLAIFCLLAVIGGWRFVVGRLSASEDKECQHYYRCWVDRMGKWPVWGTDERRSKYWFLGQISPFWLPVVSALALFACRFPISLPVGIHNAAPPMALPIMLFSIVLWLGLFGWLSLFEQRTSTGWLGFLILVVGALGLMGLTENHVIGGFVQLANPMSTETAAVNMYVWTVAISFIGFGAYAYVIRTVGRGTSLTPWRGPLAFLVPILLCIPLMYFAANSAANLPSNPESPTTNTDLPCQHTLACALTSWLDELSTNISQGDEKAIPVYFVSSEGGGIRAAYWTARILADLEEQDKNFTARTFSMSGVSGGAMGIAVYHACRQLPGPFAKPTPPLKECVSKFGDQDLLSPMVGAWLYEDLLARVIPTRWCDAPGCGFLSRGIWFENSMLNAVENLQQGIVSSYSRNNGKHQPHLFLNSTWVETGERAIASDLKISTTEFPNANDQINQFSRDMTLATAAHNASRFPFVNAIGSVRPVASKSGETIGHLADGGYFDNSGGQTTADIVKKFGQCFIDRESGCWINDPDKRLWLAKHLVPQVLMIRNGVETPLPDESRAKNQCKPRKQPDRRYLETLMRYQTDPPYHPTEPACKSELKLFADFLGPLVTAINTTGIGSNGKLAESRQQQEIKHVRGILAEIADAPTLPAVQEINHFDLSNSNQLVPLGWHLSTQAKCHMDCKSEKEVKKRILNLQESDISSICSASSTSNYKSCQEHRVEKCE